MQPSEQMSPVELRAAISLSGIFGLRMLGMFVILPVFAFYAEGLPGGEMRDGAGVGWNESFDKLAEALNEKDHHHHIRNIGRRHAGAGGTYRRHGGRL